MTVVEIESPAEITLQEVSHLLEERTDLQSIDLVNWDTFSYRPKVQFRMAHSNNAIWLKFYVTEDYILAQRTETNSATHRDSCVEFFFDPQGDGNYYNFEFNCIGTIHLAYGPDRHERSFIDPERIENEIKVSSTLGNSPFEEKGGGHSWEMTLVIPAKMLAHDEAISLKGLNAKANFYKCGDDTSAKHYLSWNPIGTERPDFHQPSFFGNLMFE
ncbi:MAG: hypothetical protein HKN31_04725 [Pricia sp.]|nr:hypothetical protein [Pricia sp.]